VGAAAAATVFAEGRSPLAVQHDRAECPLGRGRLVLVTVGGGGGGAVPVGQVGADGGIEGVAVEVFEDAADRRPRGRAALGEQVAADTECVEQFEPGACAPFGELVDALRS
jgi:hypothetical protein